MPAWQKSGGLASSLRREEALGQRSERVFAVRRQNPAEQREARRAATARLGVSDRSRPSSDTVRQVSDRTFYRRGGRWVDSLLVDRGEKAEPDRVVAFGTREFFALAERLAGEGRQGLVALPSDTLLLLDGQVVLVRHGTEMRAANAAAR